MKAHVMQNACHSQQYLNLFFWDKVIADNVNFESIDDVSLATIDRVLRRQKMRMKQVYRVPFERNSVQHKDLRYEYVQVSIHPCSQYS